MPNITHPNDYTTCCNGLGGDGCGHEGLLRMPHLHADNCQLAGNSLFREDPDERKSFERHAVILGNDDPLTAICGILDTWGRAHVRKDGYAGSYSHMCFIMANECIKASREIAELKLAQKNLPRNSDNHK